MKIIRMLKENNSVIVESITKRLFITRKKYMKEQDGIIFESNNSRELNNSNSDNLRCWELINGGK